MNLEEFKKYNICQQIGISVDKFSRIIAFIDFANVDHWFDDDQYNLDDKALLSSQHISIDLKKLKDFLGCFADDSRFYYGHNPSNLSFITVAKYIFGKRRVFTKRIQQVRHDLLPADSITNTRIVHSDNEGDFVFIPKCNFDVEIAVDAIRLVDKYDTICLLSSDADFAALIRYLKSKHKKKVILIKGEKPGTRPGSADS